MIRMLPPMAVLASSLSCICAVEDSPDSSISRDSRSDTDFIGPADPCAENTEIVDPEGQATGFVRCGDDSVNRVSSVPVSAGHYESPPTCGGDSWRDDDCASDADCSEYPNGRCYGTEDDAGPRCMCTYLCSADSDCPTGRSCLHPSATPVDGRQATIWPVCVDSVCLVNSDCSTGECGLSVLDGDHLVRLACRTSVDDCRTNLDCDDQGGNWCVPQEEEWVCTTAGWD